MKPKIYRLSDNKIGTITELIGMDLVHITWLDGSKATEDISNIRLTPEQEFKDIPLKTINWASTFWLGLMNSSDQKWINRILTIIIIYIIIRGLWIG
jgi:hypothetical protein